jgi:YidC/Oxa1 family membrane protein insertase
MNQFKDPSDKPHFLDRNTIIALVVVFVFFFGWSKFVEKNYTKAPSAAESIATGVNPGESVNSGAATGAANLDSAKANVDGKENAVGTNRAAIQSKGSAAFSAAQAGQKPKDEQFVQFENDVYSLQISSMGMGLKDVVIKNYTKRDKTPVVLAAGLGLRAYAASLAGVGGPLEFKVERKSEYEFFGLAVLDGFRVERTLRFSKNSYGFESETRVLSGEPRNIGLQFTLSELAPEKPASSGFLVPSYDHSDWYVSHDTTSTRAVIDPSATLNVEHANVGLAALSSHYFSSMILDRSTVAPKYINHSGPGQASAVLIYTPVNASNEFVVKQVGFSGPKSVAALKSVDEKLTTVIDFGVFKALAVPMIWLLKQFEGLAGNWGIAIILLTLLLRIVMLPLNVYSFKSMKALQKIQPEMKAIKERLKDDPTKMNQEVMQLMKASNASPLGGCIPTLLQIPVFFAFNAVLGQSIELYMAPFFLWIKDLSVHDHIFVLPVLMGIAMFFQSRLTPVADPQQAKMMQWMPVVFSVMMIYLPSGLTLYILVNTLFGIGQQYFLMREKGSEIIGKTAKA